MTEKKDNLKIVGKQKTFVGEDIELLEYKNIEEKRKMKEEILRRFKGEMIRSILTPRDIDKNVRLNKLEREYRRGRGVLDTIERVKKFSKKTMDTISTFPSFLTELYLILLTKEGDKVFDAFMGHNSRAEDVLSLNRNYYAYDIHKFPFEFTKEAIKRFEKEKYELNLGSSEKVKYADESFDFSITCPPYFNMEPYNRLYGEEKEEDLSSKNYRNFLFSYYKCLKETYRVLKKGSFFVNVVGDFVKGGKYVNFMYDTIKICKICGFTLHDINIYNRKSNIGGDLNYKSFILTSKRFPTIHEFILIFKK